MQANVRKQESFRTSRFLIQFWEAWLLALFLVTILGLLGKTAPRPMLTKADFNRSQFDPLEMQPQMPNSEGRPLESGF
jgi:hypothetical protein